jgi:hypothetical protein
MCVEVLVFIAVQEPFLCACVCFFADSISSGSSDRVQSTGVVSRSDALKLASNASLSSVPGTESVASWASDDVEKWLRCNNLDFAAVRSVQR